MKHSSKVVMKQLRDIHVMYILYIDHFRLTLSPARSKISFFNLCGRKGKQKGNFFRFNAAYIQVLLEKFWPIPTEHCKLFRNSK